MQINTEYRKGILFIRLIGRIDDNEYLTKINDIIDTFGIKYIVLNLDKVKDVSLENIDHIIKYNRKILKKKKLLFICDSNKRGGILSNLKILNISNELEAFSLI